MADSTTDKGIIVPITELPVSKSPVSTRQLQLDAGDGKVVREGQEARVVAQSLESSPGQLEKLRSFEFHALVGDYAGKVFHTVTRAGGKDLNISVSKLRGLLKAREDSSKAFEADNKLKALEQAIKALSSRGLSVDFDMIKLAVNAYGDRNLQFHSELRRPEIADDLVLLSKTIKRDLCQLPNVLYGDKVKDIGSWRKIFQFYYDARELEFRDIAKEKLAPFGPGPFPTIEPRGATVDSSTFQPEEAGPIIFEPESGIVESGQPSNSEPISSRLRSQKGKAPGPSDSNGGDNTRQSRDKVQKRPTRKEVKFRELSESLMDGLQELNAERPRQAIQLVKSMKEQLDELKGRS